MATAVILLLFGLLLLLLEMIIPGGIIGLIGFGCMIASVILGFMQHVALGFSLLVGGIFGGIVAFFLWVKYFPKTSIGKEMFLEKDGKNWRGYEIKNQELLHQTGVSYTPLRPSGIALIGKKRIDVITQGNMIEAGEKIKVMKVEGNRIVVALYNDEN